MNDSCNPKTNHPMKSYHLVRVFVPLICAFLSVNARAATLSVNNTNDNGAGSLRAVLASAADGDMINFSFPLQATITLTSGELVITNDLTINGPGAAHLALSGNTNSRVFNIASNCTVNLSELTIRDGLSGAGDNGGGIHNLGTLALSNCLVAFNSAGSGGGGGGIFNGGSLTAVACSFRSNIGRAGSYGQSAGGGVVVKTPTAGGPGGSGGGILNGGALTVIHCTFYDNRGGAGGHGGNTSIEGGMAAAGGSGGSGGGIFNTGILTCIGCTFSGNHAGAGGAGGNAVGFFSGGYGGSGGMAGECGGIGNTAAAGLVIVRNSIFALNAAGAGGTGGYGLYGSGGNGGPGGAPDLFGAFTSQGYNLVGIGNGSTGLVNGVNGNIVGTSTNPVHPRLGAFQDNGGPTWTLSLVTGSPAIDTGDDTLTGTDQRGFPRLSGVRVDMGAHEGVSSLFSRGEALLVGDGLNNSVAAIEVRSGAAVGTFVQPQAGVNYKAIGPRGLLCVSNLLLVVNQNVDTPFNGEILTFDLNTGVFVGKRVPSSNPNAPYAPRGIIAGSNNTLLVADVGGFDGVHLGRIARYSSQGQFLGNVSTTGLTVPFYPMGLVIGPDGYLYVSGVGNLAQGSLNGFIFRFQFNPLSQNYHYVSTLVSSTAANYYTPGLHNPEGIVFGPDGNLYVTSFYAVFSDNQGATVIDRDAILVFDKNGQRIGSPIHLFATDENRAFAQALLFGPRGDLFVPITSAGEVRRYTAESNFQQFQVLPTAGTAPQYPWYLTFRATNPSTLAYEPPKLTGLVNGDRFDVSWPAGYVGWQLQVQTNAPAVGLNSNWVDVAASFATNRVSFLRAAAEACAFYRLTAP